MSRTVIPPDPKVEKKPEAAETKPKRGPESGREATPEEAARDARARVDRESADFTRETDRTRDTVSLGTPPEQERVGEIVTEAGALIQSTEKALGSSVEQKGDVPDKFQSIFENEKVKDFFEGLSLHSLTDPVKLKKQLSTLFNEELCGELGIDPKYSEQIADRYARDLAAKGEQYLRQEAKPKGGAALKKQITQGMIGGGLYASLRRGAEFGLKIGTDAALPVKVGVSAGVGAMSAAITYVSPRIGKRIGWIKTEAQKAADSLIGNGNEAARTRSEAARARIVDQLRADLAYDIGFDRDKGKNLASLEQELRAVGDDELLAMFGESEDGAELASGRRDKLLELFESTARLKKSGGKGEGEDEGAIEERQNLIKELLADGTLERYATYQMQSKIKELVSSLEGSLDPEAKNAILMQAHIALEQRMNVILGDVVAQEKFDEIDDASKKSYAETYAAQVFGSERPETFLQAVIAGAGRGAVSGLANTSYIGGMVYMSLKGVQSGFNQEMMARREHVVQTPGEITKKIRGMRERSGAEGGEKVSIDDARQLIQDARARIKLPDIKGPDRARIETEIAELENALILNGVQRDFAQASDEDLEALVKSIAEGVVHQGEKTVSRAAKLAQQEREATSFVGTLREFKKLSREDKKGVLAGTLTKGSIGLVSGLAGGLIAGEVLDSLGVSSAHAAEPKPEESVERPVMPRGGSGTAVGTEAAGAVGAPVAAEAAPAPNVLAPIHEAVTTAGMDHLWAERLSANLGSDPTPDEVVPLVDQVQQIKGELTDLGLTTTQSVEIVAALPGIVDAVIANPDLLSDLNAKLDNAGITETSQGEILTAYPELIQNPQPIIDVQNEMESAGLNADWQGLIIAKLLATPESAALQHAAEQANQIGEGFAELNLSAEQQTELITEHADVAKNIVANPDLLAQLDNAFEKACVTETLQGEVVLAHLELLENPSAVTDLAARFDVAGLSDETLTEVLVEATGNLSSLNSTELVELLKFAVAKEYPGLEENGYEVKIDASGKVQLEMDAESEKSLGELEQIYAQLGASRFGADDLLDADGKLSDIGMAKIINVAANLVNLTEGRGLESLTDDFAKAGVTFEDGKLVISDIAAWNEVVDQLIEKANGNEEVLKDGAMAYDDNYSAKTAESIVALYGEKAGATLEVPKFSEYKSVQRAEHIQGQALGTALGVESVDVVDENTISGVLGGQPVEIRGGHIVSIGDLSDLRIDVHNFHDAGFRDTVHSTVFEAQVLSVVGADAGPDAIAAAREVAAAVHGGSDILNPRELATVNAVHESGVSVETLKDGGDDIDDDLVGVVEKHSGVTDAQMKEIALGRNALHEVAPGLASAEGVYDMLVNERWQVIPHEENSHIVMLYNQSDHSGVNLHGVGGSVEATYAPHVEPESVGRAEVVQSLIAEKPMTEPIADVTPRALARTVDTIVLRDELEHKLAGEVDEARRDSGVWSLFKRELKVPEVEKFMRDVTVEDLYRLDAEALADKIGTSESDDVKDMLEPTQAALSLSDETFPDDMTVGEALAKALAEQAAEELDARAGEATSLRGSEAESPSLRGGEAAEAISPEPVSPSLRGSEATEANSPEAAAPSLRGAESTEAIPPKLGTSLEFHNEAITKNAEYDLRTSHDYLVKEHDAMVRQFEHMRSERADDPNFDTFRGLVEQELDRHVQQVKAIEAYARGEGPEVKVTVETIGSYDAEDAAKQQLDALSVRANLGGEGTAGVAARAEAAEADMVAATESPTESGLSKLDERNMNTLFTRMSTAEGIKPWTVDALLTATPDELRDLQQVITKQHDALQTAKESGTELSRSQETSLELFEKALDLIDQRLESSPRTSA